MNYTIVITICVILLLLILAGIYIWNNAEESFDTYNLHYNRAKKYGIIDDDSELKYHWSHRKNGINKLTQIYETIPQQLPDSIPYEIPERDDIVFTLPGRTLVWTGKTY